MRPIYIPKGKAKEYGDYAINIYTGCPHRCFYCFAPGVLHKNKECFHSEIVARPGIIEAVQQQLEKEHITGKLIHLCFTCDPYPLGHNSLATRYIIKALKDAGNHVQILTKNGLDAERDFDLLDGADRFGISYAGYPVGTLFERQEAEPEAGTTAYRLAALNRAHKLGIKTWISFEPVLDAKDILSFLTLNVGYIDKYKIGKLNYHPSDINWKDFGTRAEQICRANRFGYYIKDSLRMEMEK
jgi:DNA repair photolyase